MEVTNDHINNLRLFVHRLTTTYVTLEAHELQHLNEWVAANKQGIIQGISHLATLPSQEGRADEQLTACLLAIVHLANRLYRTEQERKANHPQQQELLALVRSGLHELIDYAEFECDERFPRAIPIPESLLHVRKPTIQHDSDTTFRVLTGQGLSPGLTDVLTRYLAEFPQRTKITFAQEAYHRKLCGSIRAWLTWSGDEDTEHTLHRLLCYFNFNRMDYFDLLRQQFQQLATSSESVEVRKAALHEESIFRKTLLHGIKWAYDPDRPETVYQHAILLLENAINQLENEHRLGPQSGTDYLQSMLDQGAWSVLLDMLMEKKHFGQKASRRKVAYFLAGHFRMSDNRPLNPEVLRRSDYPHSDKDIIGLAAFAEDCLRWLKTQYPHLF